MRDTLPPFLNRNVTKEIMQNIEDTNPQLSSSHLWPFTLTISTTQFGSKTFVLEFRPMMKFAINVGFFWKSKNAT